MEHITLVEQHITLQVRTHRSIREARDEDNRVVQDDVGNPVMATVVQHDVRVVEPHKRASLLERIDGGDTSLAGTRVYEVQIDDDGGIVGFTEVARRR